MHATAVSFEEADGDAMAYVPRDAKAPIIYGMRFLMIGTHFTLLVIVMLAAHLLGLYVHSGNVLVGEIFPPGGVVLCHVLRTNGEWELVVYPECAVHATDAARTMVFISVTFCEILRGLSVRSFRNHFFSAFLKNRVILGGVI